MKTLPFKYKAIYPEEKHLKDSENPPKVKIEFFEINNNLKNISCYSNEKNTWKRSNVNFSQKYVMEINLQGKFVGERGRINCSLREKNGFWRWLGIQFVLAE